jgi:Protein of unknown function (DUF2815)
MSEVIFLSDVRLSFPHIAEPQKQVNEQTGKERISYNCEFIMPQNHPGWVKFWSVYQKMMVDEYKANAPTVMQMIQNDRKLRGFGMGSEKINKKTFAPYDGYDGNVFITAGSDRQPQMIQADGNPVDPANTMACMQLARRLYGGCRVNAAVKPWVQKNKHGNGFRCDLVAVQFLRDDTAFGEGAVDVTGLFGQVTPQPGPAAAGMQAPVMPGFFGAGLPPATGMPPPPFGAPVAPGLPSFLGG